MTKSILVVDDDDDLLYCYRLMLEGDGVQVYTSNDVDEAQRIVKNEHIDLAVLDYMMPKLTGAELAQRIHEINDKIKIIFVSGYSEALEAVKKLEMTIHGVFMKPVNPEIMEMIAESEDYEEFSQYSQDIPALNMYANI